MKQCAIEGTDTPAREHYDMVTLHNALYYTTREISSENIAFGSANINRLLHRSVRYRSVRYRSVQYVQYSSLYFVSSCGLDKIRQTHNNIQYTFIIRQINQGKNEFPTIYSPRLTVVQSFISC